jgi:uncharacterized MAPEG superfamily protein
MSGELTILAWTLVLALVQIGITGAARTRETGPGYNVGPRDDGGPPVGIITGRLQRAQSNLFETLPLFIAAVLIAHVAGKEGALTLWGARLFLAGRIVYVPLYAFGVPVVRTLAFMVAATGLVMILSAILRGG